MEKNEQRLAEEWVDSSVQYELGPDWTALKRIQNKNPRQRNDGKMPLRIDLCGAAGGEPSMTMRFVTLSA